MAYTLLKIGSLKLVLKVLNFIINTGKFLIEYAHEFIVVCQAFHVSPGCSCYGHNSIRLSNAINSPSVSSLHALHPALEEKIRIYS